MPSKNEYDLVPNDDYDARLPLHSDKAFHHGITFQAKYIGSLDVPRPTSRVEIVAAMRRIRYEFKAKGIKKKKVTIEVSVDGVRVTLRKVKKKKQFLDEGKALILSHPIYRIFYVSHDSQDLKIFSYIARDGSSNVFKCNVFKSSKKSQAMRVVRTVGQAFEVCHKLSITNPNDQEQDDKESDHLCQDVQKDAFSSEKSSNLYVKKEPFSENNVSERSSIRLAGEDPNDRLCSESISDTNPSEKPISSLNLDILPSSSNSNFTRRQEVSASETHVSPDIERLSNMSGILPTASSTLSAHHELHLLREQLEQQTQQTQAALAQVQLLRDQLAAEQSARLEAQARTHQLLTHNKELLDHITALLSHLQDNERTTLHGQQQNTVPPPISMVPQQLQGLCEPYQNDRSENQFLEHNPMYQTMGFIENPAATSCLPLTPRSAFSLNSFGALDNNQQLLQKLQSIYGYTPSNISFPSYPSYSSLHYPPVYNPQSTLNSLNTSSFTLQSPQQLQSSPLPMRHPQFRTNLMQEQKSNAAKSEYQKQQKQEQHRELYQGSSKNDVKCEEETQFIRPLSQVGTLTTTDYDGKVKVIVPVPSGAEDAGDLLKALRLNEECNKPHNVTTIQRTTSEKVPNRSELMSQVQRTGWARHTTK